MGVNTKKITLKIHMDDKPITKVDSVKFLGVHLDSHLTWAEHIRFISGQISRSAGIMFKLKFILPQRVMRIIYLSMVLPSAYCSNIWSGANKSCLKKLYILQKRAIRCVANIHYRCSTDPAFAKLNLLKLHDIITLNLLSFTYKCINGLSPSQFSDFFTTNQATHSYNTRNPDNIRIGYTCTPRFKQSVKYRATIAWKRVILGRE